MRLMRNLSASSMVGLVLFGTVFVEAGPPKPDTVSKSAGYIDSHFALSPDGTHLACVHVLRQGSANLEIYTVSDKGARRRASVPIGKITMLPLRLRFSPDGNHVLMFWRANAAALSGPLAGAVYGLNGQRVASIPAFDDYRLRKDGGKWQLITYLPVNVRWQIDHQVTIYAFPQMRKLEHHRLITDKSYRVAKPKMELVYFMDNYLKAVAKVAGHYDRAKDVRLPDKEAIYDLKAKKVISQQEIKEAVRWEQNKRFRQKYNAFDPVVVLDGAPGRGKLELVRTDNNRVALTPSISLDRFRFDSLRQQLIGRDKIVMSLTVDPQNPITLKQRKSEPEVFHLFMFSLKGRTRLEKVFSLDSEKKVLFWSYAKNTLAVMRLHKNWTLGAGRIYIYRLHKR